MDAARLETLVGKPRFVAERSWTGVEVDGLVVEELIGAGGMGTVYRARSLGDGQAPLAVKFLSPSLAAEPELVARFWREVALLEKLDHPAIVKVKAHGQNQDVPWFRESLPALLAGLVGVILVATANGCVQSNCAAACMSSLDLDFDSPIGQPGTYQFTIGSHSCSVVLPAASAPCVTIRDFAVVGFHSNESPTRSLHVTVSN